MKLFSMKIWQSALASLLLLCLLSLPAVAGQWKLEGYFWSGTATSANVSWSQNYHSNGSYETRIQTKKNIFRDGVRLSNSYVVPSQAQVSVSGYPLWGGESVSQKGIAEAKGEVGSSVYARFNWQRNMKGGYSEITGTYSYYPDPDDNPPSYIYVREIGSVSATTNIRQFDGNSTGYDALRPWQGDYYKITGSGMGVELGDASRPEYNRYNSWQYGPNRKTEIRKIAVSGDSAVVPSQSFQGEIKLSPGYEKEIPDQPATANLYFGYEADALNFSLNASGFAVANRKQTNSNTESIDALVELRWLSPDNLETSADGEHKIVPSRNQARGFWSTYFGGGEMDDGAPIPYFAGQATFNVTATGSDGYSPIFDSPIYKWTPKDNSDPFDPDGHGTPGFVATSPSQRTYVWNFGSASDGAGSFPQTSSVSVEVKSGNPNDDSSGSLTATKTINWYTAWSPTETGLQKNVVTPQFDWLTLPDGSPINANNVKPGDTILCFVEGDPGFSTDGGHIEKIRPVPFGQQNSPGPGERVEPRVVGSVVPTGSGGTIITCNSTPKVNPDDDENAAGFDEIQQTRAIAAASEQTYQTGKALVKGALEIQLELMKAAAYGPAQGVAIESAIKGIIAAGRFAEAAKDMRAGITVLEKGAEDARAAARAAEVLKAKGGLNAEQLVRVEKDIAYFKGQAARNDQLIKDTQSMITTGEKYSAEAAARLKRDGCFVAGTPVWMSDGTTKSIEQIKVGDSVLSKNEQTGMIAAKKVLHTSVRPDIWTRKLTFENGTILETTDEHPLYVEGSGFVKAKEVGIGSSIVTRAGPSVKVVAVQADVRQATVYNFTVDEFHTYFVGQDALWVHNVDCLTYPEPSANGNTLVWEETDADKLVIDNPANPGSPITDFDRVVKAPNGDIWVVERKGVVDIYNPKNPAPEEKQITDFLDSNITGKLDKIKKAIFEGAPQDLAKAQITDPTRVKIAFDFHGSDGKDIDLTVLGRCVERIKQWEGANPGYNVAVKWGG